MDTVTAPGGARVRRPGRPGPRRPARTPAAAAAAAALLLAATAACTATRTAPAARTTASRAPSTAAASPARPAASPRELCVRLVAHWTHRVLDGGPHSHLDYQEMGLSGGQYEILRAAVAAGRAVAPRRGPAAAHDAATREVERGCAERYRHGTPTGGPWQ
ncbi:hypothetical protein [Streptomyces sp. NRRL S-87]|uniref:hypothetical protein n=1 Tax=Streptomyces sp. NRRL S-87 TaxID=1463920 RepID=UPI00069193A9|nr:hypothetical protein [Streptomyces sp. NRRL S-87]